MSNINFFEVLGDILDVHGEITTPNPTLVYSQFDNEKVRIRGVMEQRTDSNKIRWVYAKYYVFLNMPWKNVFQMAIPDKVWGMSVDPQTTLVYYGLAGDKSTEDVFCVGGRWQTYLLTIFNRIQKRKQALQQYNMTSVDDDEMFPRGAYW